MKKPYRKPVVTKIALNYQQAVLAACSVGQSARPTNDAANFCSATPGCRVSRKGDSAGNS